MQKPNRIIHKYLMPYHLGAAVAVSLIVFGTTTLLKTPEPAQNDADKKTVPNLDFAPQAAGLIGIMIASFLLINAGVKSKEAKSFAINATSQYLNTVFTETPQLDHFFHIMYDRKSIKNVCTFICNALPKDKRNEILMAVKVLDKCNVNHRSEYEQAIQETITKIVKIVKDYAHSNPDFVYGVNDMIAHAYNTYVVPDPYYTR